MVQTENMAEVTKHGLIDMQVCVPDSWNDKQVVEFANRENLCGTSNGWSIRREDNPVLNGDGERVTCSDREGFVHIMLEC